MQSLTVTFWQVFEDGRGDIPESCLCDTMQCQETLLPIGVRVIIQPRTPHTYVQGTYIFCPPYNEGAECATCADSLPF